MDKTTEKLAQELKMTTGELVSYIGQLDQQFNLGMDNYHELTQLHYDIIRGSLDTGYMIKCMRRVKRKGQAHGEPCDRTQVPGYPDLANFLMTQELNGLSAAEVQALIPDTLPHCSLQMAATILRELGYVKKTVVLSTGKQGRRWFKAPGVDETTISFI